MEMEGHAVRIMGFTDYYVVELYINKLALLLSLYKWSGDARHRN